MTPILLTVAGNAENQDRGLVLCCNVFRSMRRKELIWAVLFLLNTSVWFISGCLEWPPVFVAQLPISVFLIAAEIRNPRYHGIFAQSWNVHLNDYLSGRIQ